MITIILKFEYKRCFSSKEDETMYYKEKEIFLLQLTKLIDILKTIFENAMIKFIANQYLLDTFDLVLNETAGISNGRYFVK